jgi:predicted Zn-dependent protease
MTRRAVLVPLSGLLLAGGLLLGPAACARNPVTGKEQLSLVSESQEIEMGKQSAQQVAQTIGIYNDQALNQYVSSIGMKMA